MDAWDVAHPSAFQEGRVSLKQADKYFLQILRPTIAKEACQAYSSSILCP